MTNRRKPSQRPTSSSWNPGRPRAELVKAIGGAAGVVILTALIIFAIKPGDPASTTPTSPGVTVPNSSTGSTGSTGATGGTGSTGSTATTAPTTATTAPASSTTQP